MKKSIFTALLVVVTGTLYAETADPRPNILLLLTDDQGYADLGCHGNPVLKTPTIDRFSKEGTEFTRFYVSPVCAPTRASLMTGRYNYRTGVTDTWFGRSTMAAEEFTLAEALQQASYVTGLFGKWHLGDTYPYRPEDQGFDEVLRHRGGGIAQPSCPPGNSYFDPLLLHNGKMEKFPGYCMDIYTDSAIRFIEANKGNPFFAYLATNTPHSPLQVSDAYADPYRKKGLAEDTAKAYGMIANIDDNFARVLAKLDQLDLSKNTIVIFMTDNGPRIFSPDRFTGTLRGKKGDVFEGGIHVPFFIRWPGHVSPGQKVDTIAAHIDLMPTLLDACGIQLPQTNPLDGISLMPLLRNEKMDAPNRTLYFQWHRGNAPSPYRNFAAVRQQYKLLQNQNHHQAERPLKFELFNLQDDLAETTDIAGQHPEILEKMKADYDRWFSSISTTREFSPSPAWIGTTHENPVVLTQQDRKGTEHWGNGTYYPNAYWPIRVITEGEYTCTMRFYTPLNSRGRAFLKVGDRVMKERVDEGAEAYTFKTTHLGKDDTTITAWLESDSQKVSPRFLDLTFETQE